jgi:type VI secretion system secreted protein Hcp
MTRAHLLFLAVLGVFLALAPWTDAAETVHLYLKTDGTDIKGESTQTSLGRDNSIECTSYEQKIETPTEVGSARATGRTQVGQIIIRKRIDKASPLLIEALVKNKVCEARFRFFRPNPTGDGTTEQFYSVWFKEGRITSVRQFVPDTIQPSTSSDPPMEEVAFSAANIQYIFVNGGITGYAGEDVWGNAGGTTTTGGGGTDTTTTSGVGTGTAGGGAFVVPQANDT